jgi:hypothetical protein
LNNCVINPPSNDTLFVDVAENDYHLDDDSPAINVGLSGLFDYLNIPVVYDLDTRPRNGTPDIGAYEK